MKNRTAAAWLYAQFITFVQEDVIGGLTPTVHRTSKARP
jgi:hypothetical protein